MPKVPVEQVGISTNVPEAHTPLAHQFGQTGVALEGLGSDIEGQSMAIHDQLVHLQAADSSENAFAQTKMESTQKMNQLKLQSPDGFMHTNSQDPTSPYVMNDDKTPRSIMQEYHSWADAHYQQQQQNMPTGIATEMYRQKALPYISGEVASISHEGMQMQAASWDQNRSFQMMKDNDALESNPSVSKMYQNFDFASRANQSVTGIIGNATEMSKRTQDQLEAYGKAQMNGINLNALDLKKEGDPSRVDDVRLGLALLRGDYSRDPLNPNASGKPQFTTAAASVRWDEEAFQHQVRSGAGQPTLSNSMKPQDRYQEERRLIANLPKAAGMDSGDLGRQLDNWVAGMDAKARMLPGDPSQALLSSDPAKGAQLAAQIAADPKRTDLDKIQSWGKIAAATWQSQAMGPDSHLGSRADRMNSVPDAIQGSQAIMQQWAQRYGVQYDKDAGNRALTEVYSQVKNRIDSDEEAKSKDSAQYFQTYSRAGQNLVGTNWQDSASVAKKADLLQSIGTAQQSWQKSAGPENPLDARAPNMTQDVSKQISDVLKNPNSRTEQQAAKDIFNYRTGFGKDFPAAIDQMVKDKNLSPAWRLVSLQANTSQNQGRMSALVSALRGGTTETNEAFDKQMVNQGTPTLVRDLNDAVQKQFSGYIASQYAAHPGSVSQQEFNKSFNDVATTYSKQLMLSDPSLTPDQAAKQTAQRLIKENVGTATVGGSHWWGSSSYRASTLSYPRVGPNGEQRQDNDPNLISNLNSFQSPESLQARNVAIPTNSINGKPDLPPENVMQNISRYSTVFHDSPSNTWRMRYSSPDPTVPGAAHNQIIMTKNAAGQLVPLELKDNDAWRQTPAGASTTQKVEKWMGGIFGGGK